MKKAARKGACRADAPANQDSIPQFPEKEKRPGAGNGNFEIGAFQRLHFPAGQPTPEEFIRRILFLLGEEHPDECPETRKDSQ